MPNDEVQMELKWEDGFMIRIRTENNAAIISANREGLLSLANHITALAEEKPGSHLHLDEYNSLEEGSAELIIDFALPQPQTEDHPE